MKTQRMNYVAPLSYTITMEESTPLCGSKNKVAGTIGGNGTQAGEHITYGGEDNTGDENISADSKFNNFSVWDEWE